MNLPSAGDVYIHMGDRLRVISVEEGKIWLIPMLPALENTWSSRWIKPARSFQLPLEAFMDHRVRGLLEQE